jgi:hypothetical protein
MKDERKNRKLISMNKRWENSFDDTEFVCAHSNYADK